MRVTLLGRAEGGTYFSLMGTMMYFLLKMSILDDHFLTLGYASAILQTISIIKLSLSEMKQMLTLFCC